MDKRDALKIASQFGYVVKTKYDFVKIILFGSYAKGNYTDESDIDIAIVMRDYQSTLDVQRDLMRLRRKIDSRIEPHPFRENDFEINNPLVNEIMKYGQEIHIT